MFCFPFPLITYRQLARIAELQCLLVDMGAVVKVLPLLSRSNDEIARETLAFISTMLFNANEVVQVSDREQLF